MPVIRRRMGFVRHVGTKLRLASWALREVLKRSLPELILHFGTTLGDDLLCTAVLRELRIRRRHRTWMMSKHPGLFMHNTDVDQIVPVDNRYRGLARRIGAKFIDLKYCDRDSDNDQDTVPPSHIIAELCRCAGIQGSVTIRPYLSLRPEERHIDYSDRRIAIHSTGVSATCPMLNKEWRPERFQKVVKALRRDFEFVQLGAITDPPLEGAIDMRGKTCIREAAAIFASSRLFVGLEGFVMHLARAVNRRSVIVYGGRSLPSQTGYPCNENLSTRLPCSPCWRWNSCDYGRRCLSVITSDHVVDAIYRACDRLHDPIETETIDIGPPNGSS
jgi:hypothetical protein